MRSPRTARPIGVVAGTAVLALLATVPAQASPETAPSASPTASPTPTASPSPTAGSTPSAGSSPSASPVAVVLPGKLKLGDKGKNVRKLQSRLNQAGFHDDHITSTFDADTQLGVAGFQRKYKLKGTKGVAGNAVWKKLLEVTREPTANELNNVYKPGKTLMKKGTKGKKVRNLEARLAQVKLFKGKVGAVYDAKTVTSVRKWQKKMKLPVTGKVDARTLQRLEKSTRVPTKTEMYNLSVKGSKLDERCKTGRVLCIDKTDRSLRWVINGVVKKRLDARFGGSRTATREGQFKVYWKSRNHVSSLYNSPMPFAMFFSGGQAVHYSVDFATRGYNGASHGCVNIRDRAAIERLFDTVRVGDKVVVYRS